MSLLKRIGSALLCAAMLICVCCSCNQSATKIIMTVAGEEVPAGIYILYIKSAIGELEDKIAEDEYEGDKWDYTVDGQAADQWVKDQALQYTLELIAVEHEFEKRDLSFTAEEQSNIDYMCNYYWMYFGASYEKMGVSFTSFERVQKGSYLSQKILLSQYGEDGTDPIPDEELKTYMEENYMRLNHILISSQKDDGSGEQLEGDELSEAESKADKLFELAKAADDIAFIELIKENSADYDSESDTESSLELGMISPIEDSGYVEEFEKCAAELEIGGTDMCKSDYGWHIIRRYAMFDDGVVELDDYRDSVIINMKEDEYNDSRSEWADALREQMVLVEESVERYDPKSSKFDLS